MSLPVPAGAPADPTLDELAAWLSARGVAVRWHPVVRPLFKVDRISTRGAKSVLELLQRMHVTSRGTRIRFEADGAAVMQTNLTARRAWMEWWEKR